MVSICSICYETDESSQHLFFSCPFAILLWQWLSNALSMTVDASYLASVFSICNRQWSKQTKDVIVAAVINTLWVIWSKIV